MFYILISIFRTVIAEIVRPLSSFMIKSTATVMHDLHKIKNSREAAPKTRLVPLIANLLLSQKN